MSQGTTYECRGHASSGPSKGREKARNWSKKFTTVWGPLANRPTRKGK